MLGDTVYSWKSHTELSTDRYDWWNDSAFTSAWMLADESRNEYGIALSTSGEEGVDDLKLRTRLD